MRDGPASGEELMVLFVPMSSIILSIPFLSTTNLSFAICVSINYWIHLRDAMVMIGLAANELAVDVSLWEEIGADRVGCWLRWFLWPLLHDDGHHWCTCLVAQITLGDV